MNELDIVRAILARIGRSTGASSRLALNITEWAQSNSAWLRPGENTDAPALVWAWVQALTEATTDETVPEAHVLRIGRELAALLQLGDFDAALLRLMLACSRLPRATSLVGVASSHGVYLPQLLGELAGAEPDRADSAVRRSPVLRMGLFGFASDRDGALSIAVLWPLERLLDKAPESGPALFDALVGPRQESDLGLTDFAHVKQADFLVRLLKGAVGENAPGVNILVHGPPGTGKTEIAKVIAAAAGTSLHAIGECDENDGEPNRWERVSALQLAQAVAAGRGERVLLFDEMEDLIGNARRDRTETISGREGSKVFINRLLETNAVPVIWTTNAIENIDPAIVRRMSFVLHLDRPPRSAAQRILARIAEGEGIAVSDRLSVYVDQKPEAASVLRVAARAARLAGDGDGGLAVAQSLVTALSGQAAPARRSESLDLDLFETDRSIEALFASIAESGYADVSLLLTGPPGTGKTALAHHLARRLDRPLVVKRGSDLLSKWVGQTEANIADAFADARRDGAVLLFDEADSLIFDRSNAQNTWEVSQVNEFLTWMEDHPLPVVAATNHPGQLDQATLRRFDYKLALRPLGPERAARAFIRAFGSPAPAELAQLNGLTPGDFTVVARQLRHSPAESAVDIVTRLAAECAVKWGTMGRIGF